MSTTTADLINDLIKQSQKLSNTNAVNSDDLGRDIGSRARDISSRDRDINSQVTIYNKQSTKGSRDLVEVTGLQAETCPSDFGVGSNPKPKAGSEVNDLVLDLVESRLAEEISMRDQISGINVQKLKSSKESIQFYLTVQFKNQVESFDADKYSAWLKPRSRGREFKPETTFEREVYDITVQYKDWYLGRLTERGHGGKTIEGIALTFDPTTNQLSLWFDDYSDAIEVQIDNGILTEPQTLRFETTGSWGEQVILTDPSRPRFGQSRSTVKGGNV
jgi:hypothetical protein